MNFLENVNVNVKQHRGIEFFGLCGAGKSTIIGEFLGALNERAVKLRYRAERPVVPNIHSWIVSSGWLALRILGGSPSTAAQLIADRNGRWLFKKLGYRIAGLQMRQDLDGAVLLDSGVLQPLVSFNVEYNFNLIPFDEHALLNILPLPSHAVYVRVPANIAMQRYIERGRRKEIKVCEHNIVERFQMGYTLAERIYDCCRFMGVRTAIYDATGPMDVKQIRRVVEELFQEGNG